ncbi:helix-turn-helix domain-containing protein, partial [Kitasatospora sp. NPDC051914]|uniref:helix-turn-helix domain-containing protein n=1 Tax=Kitasatospora sp. NPDC051914 TaxID=3154945 RepID=UPI0034454F4D
MHPAGRTATEIAGIVTVHPATARGALRRYDAGGLSAPADAPRSGRPPKITPADLDTPENMLDECAENGGPSWTLPRLAAWLERGRGVRIHSARLSVLLERDGFRYERTRTTVRHKADEALQRSARDGHAGGPAAVRLGAEAGDIELFHLDEAGFAPTLPTGYTWARRGTRALVLQEGTCGRRVNALGALRIDRSWRPRRHPLLPAALQPGAEQDRTRVAIGEARRHPDPRLPVDPRTPGNRRPG